jgi:hypothetical protein
MEKLGNKELVILLPDGDFPAVSAISFIPRV